MRSATRIALGMAMACVLASQLVTPAAAARGTFTFYDDDGGAGVVDPRDNTCYPLGSTVRRVENRTDRQAVLYNSTDCTGKSALVLPPRKGRDIAKVTAVMFVRTRR
ncbi:hypothetical protein [Actinokineospora globicatena]|uniref:Peptidase inhibitor family I36 n=1 Tax=Actinokineospora globicatena TaxID=103729 RepID=A0A9W6QRE3_9PSEU|nr:hypothetical protein [Actinokineospora globicatena]GLW93269.1 hypothetical protein Aglo03_40850 [Actinokineospora globicatena]